MSLSSSARGKNRFRPQLETLGERLVPAITNFNFNPADQSLIIETDNGSDGILINDLGSSGAGNLQIQALDVTTWRNDPLSGALNDVLRRNHVSTLRVWDFDPNEFSDGGSFGILWWRQRLPGYQSDINGGNNQVAYIANSHPSIRVLDFIGGRDNDVFYVDIRDGLAAGQILGIKAVGGSGGDTLQVMVGGTFRAGSVLGIDMAGQLGWDVVDVNAYSRRPTFEYGSLLDVRLYANAYNTFNDLRDSDNNVGFAYRGRMDGRINFDLQGSGSNDWVSADIFLESGSQGKIGQLNTQTFARVAGGAGNDDMNLFMNWDILDGLSHFDSPLLIDGGSGWNRAHFTRISGINQALHEVSGTIQEYFPV